MFRFSGAFGWNPPFAPGPQAHNKAGAMAPDPNEYWNYGSDEDFEDANRWDGSAFPPPEEEDEAGEEEAPAEKAPVTSLAAAKLCRERRPRLPRRTDSSRLELCVGLGHSELIMNPRNLSTCPTGMHPPAALQVPSRLHATGHSPRVTLCWLPL
jgi:hypothetical protein